VETIQILVLAFVQGLTEFLPISSSGHLILTPLLFGYELQSLAFDVAVHLGTLAAVVFYFRREIARMLVAVLDSLRTRRFDDPDAQLGWMIVLATLPVVVLGLPLKSVLEWLREDDQLIALVIAGTTIGFGLLLGWADWRGRRERNEYRLGWGDALIIGLLQAIAIIPGISRSGITITAGLLLGLTRQAASRFSFLLAIPTILMAGGARDAGSDSSRRAGRLEWTGARRHGVLSGRLSHHPLLPALHRAHQHAALCALSRPARRGHPRRCSISDRIRSWTRHHRVWPPSFGSQLSSAFSIVAEGVRVDLGRTQIGVGDLVVAEPMAEQKGLAACGRVQTMDGL
jgi:undecaprenyl-diphosphatase